MQSEVDSLKQRISELETEKAELEAKNAELLKQVTEESTKREDENVELKARIAKLEQIAEENTKLKDRITKLEQKQIQVITNEQEASPTKDISPLIDSHSYEEKKERISSEIRERNREKKLQESPNNLTPPIQSEASTMSTPESLDTKTVKKLWVQNQNKSLDKTFQSHKKKGTENIVQVIADGIQDNFISDESRSFASSNYVTDISATVHRQNSDTISLLDLPETKSETSEFPQIENDAEEKILFVPRVNVQSTPPK
ncbi:hypothetical protein F8M41_006882 [Gigaspora margarita]|uniref:Uncharacterized protein n=1 Tax=Gigaspora margarita TaxID=4874 RepID=A0A8H4A3E5_GIGMA|nr:hypothetical protein F8M41_006882 [Gigaspora margarita]